MFFCFFLSFLFIDIAQFINEFIWAYLFFFLVGNNVPKKKEYADFEIGIYLANEKKMSRQSWPKRYAWKMLEE